MHQEPQHDTTPAHANEAVAVTDAATPYVAPAPSIGRVVWYYPYVAEIGGAGFAAGQPHSAQIAHVWSPSCVNLGIFDCNGKAYGRCSVALYHPDAVPDWQEKTGGYATWMPYQCR